MKRIGAWLGWAISSRPSHRIQRIGRLSDLSWTRQMGASGSGNANELNNSAAATRSFGRARQLDYASESTMQLFQSRLRLGLLLAAVFTGATCCHSQQLHTNNIQSNLNDVQSTGPSIGNSNAIGIDLSKTTNGQQEQHELTQSQTQPQASNQSSTNQHFDIASDEKVPSIDLQRSSALINNNSTREAKSASVGLSAAPNNQQPARGLADGDELEHDSISSQPSQLVASTSTQVAPYVAGASSQEELVAAASKKKKKMMKKKKKMEKKHKEWKKGKKHKKKKYESKKKKGGMMKKKKGKKMKKKWGMEKKGHKKKGNFKKKKWGQKKKMKKGHKKGKKGHKMLKDKGHKKKGFKKVYHKEEWGKKKKWHDIKREKKWNTKQKKWKKKWHQEKGKKYKGKHMKKYHKKNKHGKKYKKEKKEKYKKHKGEKYKKGHKKKKEEYAKKKEGGKKKKMKKMKKEMKKKKG